jgi:ornithine carbamoyltransferase
MAVEGLGMRVNTGSRAGSGIKKDLVSILDLGPRLEEVLDLAARIKSGENESYYQKILENKSMAMIFEKSSTRTRVSFEVAMTQLGGHSLFLSPKDLQLARGETVSDTARVLSRYVDIIMYRAFDHNIMKELAAAANVPVINALDNLEHPCQIVADLLTIKEFKKDLHEIDCAYVGDGNNVCNSLLLGAASVGMNIHIGCPENYLPDLNILEITKELAEKNHCSIDITSNPAEAVRNCDVIYTDVWISMGDEGEVNKRKDVFRPYQVNRELVSQAKDDYIFMHCLPAHRGDEVVDEILDSEHSVVFDQAENRLHAQKAIILYLLNKTD